MTHAKGSTPFQCCFIAISKKGAQPCVLWRRYDGKLRSSMLEHFNEDLCDWLITEMAQNRDKKLVARKVCNFNTKICQLQYKDMPV